MSLFFVTELFLRVFGADFFGADFFPLVLVILVDPFFASLLLKFSLHLGRLVSFCFDVPRPVRFSLECRSVSKSYHAFDHLVSALEAQQQGMVE